MSASDPVSAANWQQPDRVRWSFQHLDEILATMPIPADPARAVQLPREPVELDDLEVRLGDGSASTVTDVFATTDTDAWLVLHAGRLVAERYLGEMTSSTRHLLMSVSKSLVSSVAGVLVSRGLLDPEAEVTTYVAELGTSGYAGATVRHLLDMRSGIRFSEEYLEAGSEVAQLDQASGWAPRQPGSAASIKEFLVTLQQVRPHGGPFEYRSCETDVLGWVCEEAAGRPFPELASELVWQRLGASSDALITVDPEGTGLFDGGICATPVDLVAFGAMVLGRGVSLTGDVVLPTWWVDDVFTGGPDSRAAFAASGHDDMAGGMYRTNFWIPRAGSDLALCLGIHGQMIYLNRATDTVGVKVSSWPLPLDDEKLDRDLAVFDAISTHLAAEHA